MRTLILNSMFANALYRKCADELGAISGMDLTMVTVDAWVMNGKPMPFEELGAGSPYRTYVGKAGWKGKENRGFYRSGLVRAFRESKPEVLFLMEEPFSVFAAQVLAVKSFVAPHIPVVFFTWNNLSLETFDYRPSIFYRNVAKLTLPRMHYGLTANVAGIDVLRKAGFTLPVRTVGYGVDTDAYSTLHPERVAALRARLDIDPGDFVIGYVGRLIPMKGVDLLVDAFARLVAEYPSKPLKLLLVGSGEAEDEIEARLGQHGVKHLCRRVPVVQHNEVPDYMHALDLLVLPSRRVGMWAEQFGRVLVEAMAAGKLVIGSSSGAIPEVIGSAGFVFHENDAGSLASQLRRALLLNPDERARLAQVAQVRATRDYSWKRFAGDAFEAIEHCHSHSRAGRNHE